MHAVPRPQARERVAAGRVRDVRKKHRAVRMVMQVSSLPLKEKWPTQPAYGPREVCSSSEMICMARIFGAPLTVPVHPPQ